MALIAMPPQSIESKGRVPGWKIEIWLGKLTATNPETISVRCGLDVAGSIGCNFPLTLAAAQVSLYARSRARSTLNRIQPGLDPARLRAFSARLYGQRPDRVELELQPLSGGLEARAVVRVEVRFKEKDRPSCAFAVKCISDSQRRELAAYEVLAQAGMTFAPRLLGFDHAGSDTTYLYLEWIGSCCKWPWSVPANAGSVLRRLASIHSVGALALPPPLSAWQYETELRASAESTVEAFANAAGREELRAVRWRRRLLERVVGALPAIRRQLMSNAVLLHGDVHSGNVALRKRGDSLDPILFDWSRIRLGSPLEDVSAWLQSLGYWEWQARRRHDTLMRVYLEARGLRPVFTNEMRELYWLAGASNALSGALRYHATFVNDNWPPEVRAEHAAAACHWLRVIRRAHSCWYS